MHLAAISTLAGAPGRKLPCVKQIKWNFLIVAINCRSQGTFFIESAANDVVRLVDCFGKQYCKRITITHKAKEAGRWPNIVFECRVKPR